MRAQPRHSSTNESGPHCVQAKIVGADKSWYGEVSNPGGIQGHYTQLVWADTEELGCGLTHYKVNIALSLEYCLLIYIDV